MVDTVRLDHPTMRLWQGFDPETKQKARIPIMCGVPMQLMDDVMYIAAARSRPAARLMARTPDILRHMAHQTTVKTERCIGHVRGPIQWSETITAWSSGIGVDDVFVCGTPQRDFDVPENRLLVWLLKRLVAGGRRCTGDAAGWFAPDEVERVREQGRAAQKLLAHRTLRTVTVRKVDGRELRLIRKSRHLATYGPALKLAERVTNPFTALDARALVSDATVEHHRVMMMLLDAVRAQGRAVPMLTIRGDFMVSGPLRYRNPSIMVDRRLSAENGLYFGDTRVVARLDDPDGISGPFVRIEDSEGAAALVASTLGTSRRQPAQSTQSASGLVQLPGSYSS